MRSSLLPLAELSWANKPLARTTITLSAEPQAVFKVHAVSRLAHRIPGHGQPILACQFSPVSSSRLATGSGDNTARIWDTDSGTPKHTLKGHTGWVLSVNWRPDGKQLATCSMDKTVRIWDPETGKPFGQELKGHAKWVLAAAWEPYHREYLRLSGRRCAFANYSRSVWRDGTARLASVSKDGTCRIWLVNSGRTEHVLSGHKGSVSCVRWGGTGMIYTGSHDKSVRVWDAVKGTLAHSFTAHGHWVNHIALSSDHALRTAYADHTGEVPETEEGKRAKALERFEKAAKIQGKVAERLVSASTSAWWLGCVRYPLTSHLGDDFTMYLWDPTNNGNKPVARLLGHQNKVNQVQFSPDGTLIASAGWDNSTVSLLRYNLWFFPASSCLTPDSETLERKGRQVSQESSGPRRAGKPTESPTANCRSLHAHTIIPGLPMCVVCRQQTSCHRQQGLHAQGVERTERQPRHGPAGTRRRGNNAHPGRPAPVPCYCHGLTRVGLSGLRRRLGGGREDGRLGREGQGREDVEELSKLTGEGREPMIPCHAVLAYSSEKNGPNSRERDATPSAVSPWELATTSSTITGKVLVVRRRYGT